MRFVKKIGKKLFTKNKYGQLVFFKLANLFFLQSAVYWENRYQKNGNSGAGSYGEKAAYKADFLNAFVQEKKIKTVIEWGCGDGNQLSYFKFPEYKGFDVSETAVGKCRKLFSGDHSKSFYGPGETISYEAELAISLDVIFHLVEDRVYVEYMDQLFSSASRYVIIYAWDVEQEMKFHVRHRCFSNWIRENISDFHLLQVTRKATYCDFFVYEKMKIS